MFTSISRNHPKKNFPTLVRAATHLKTQTEKPFKMVFARARVKELAPLAKELCCDDVVGDAPGARDVVRHSKDATIVELMDYEGFAKGRKSERG